MQIRRLTVEDAFIAAKLEDILFERADEMWHISDR